MADLSHKRDRERLKARDWPYYKRLTEGAYLGFRRGPDTWIARFRGRDGKQQYKPLGEALGFDEAKRRAEEWLSQLAGSAVRTITRATVQAALESYLADLKRHGRHDAAKEALWRFKVVVYEDPIAGLELEAATKDDFRDWRDRLTPGRQPRSVNRYVRAVAAGLNRAVEDLGHVGNPAAWRLTPLSDDVEDEGETAVFLTPEQRKALISNAEPHTAAFLRGLELTGARPKELAGAVVEDFDGKSVKLAHRKGKPPKLRTRRVVLSAEGIKFFERETRGKLPKAPIFTEDGEQPWRRHVWARQFRAVVAKVNEREE